MVTKAVWDAICTFLGFLVGLIPDVALPTWVDDVSTYMTQGMAFVDGMYNWIPVGALGNASIFLMTVSGLVLTVRVVRIAISMFTGGGGSAA